MGNEHQKSGAGGDKTRVRAGGGGLVAWIKRQLAWPDWKTDGLVLMNEGAGAGPFTVDLVTVEHGDIAVVQDGRVGVFAADGSLFALVRTMDCGHINDLPAAIARATLIAEALNATQPSDYETSLTMPEALARECHITEVFVGGRRFIPEPQN